MTSPRATVPAGNGTELLERAVGYTRGSLQLVGRHGLSRRTPCAGWDLAALLHHMDDSLAAFTEAALGGVSSYDGGTVPVTDVRQRVDRLRDRACALLGAWSALGHREVMTVDGLPVPVPLMAAVGALEISTHGWDVARASGVERPLPAALAAELLPWVPRLVTAADRPRRFGPPRLVLPLSGPGERLLAALGRDPAWPDAAGGASGVRAS